MITELNTRVADQLERLAYELTEKIPLQLGKEQTPAAYAETVDRQRAVQQRVQYLKRVSAGLALADPEALKPGRVGFASTVRVEEMGSGELMSYTIMNGEELNLDAGEISIASPVAQALIGHGEEDVVEVATPQRRRKLRILSITTIFEVVGMQDAAEAGLDSGRSSPQDPVAALVS